MNRIMIQSVEVCDDGKAPLPKSPTEPDAFLVPILPDNTTGVLYLHIVCTLIPAGIGPIKYRLTVQNLADWRFSCPGPSSSVQEYTINTQNWKDEYLSFCLKLLNPCPTALSCNILIAAMDPGTSPPNIAREVVTVSCK